MTAGCRRTVLTKEDIQRSPRIRANEANAQPVADLFVVEAALRHELRKGILLMLHREKLKDRQDIATQNRSNHNAWKVRS